MEGPAIFYRLMMSFFFKAFLTLKFKNAENLTLKHDRIQ